VRAVIWGSFPKYFCHAASFSNATFGVPAYSSSGSMFHPSIGLNATALYRLALVTVTGVTTISGLHVGWD
jgi:hypothetical protein